MSEVSCSSMSVTGLNREILNKSYKNSFNFISENSYVKPEADNKEVIYLKKAVNRLEQNIDFLRNEHCQMLEGLQKQIEKLREENHDLQFQLIMRSDRTNEPDNRLMGKPKESDLANSKLLSDQISFLKSALEDEKQKNKSLLDQLELIRETSGDKLLVDGFTADREEISLTKDENVPISCDIRISLNPLSVSTYHRDSGLYLVKEPLTVEDCEMVIQTLLKKMDNCSDMHDRSALSKELGSNPRSKIVPGIKKPLQPIKPLSRGSTNLKLSQINGSQCSNPVRISSAQKLIPIISHKHEVNKLEQCIQTLNGSRSERECKPMEGLPVYKETKTGSSLPALPRPNDYNHADKQRRLHILQKKRLDQYNNRS